MDALPIIGVVQGSFRSADTAGDVDDFAYGDQLLVTWNGSQHFDVQINLRVIEGFV